MSLNKILKKQYFARECDDSSCDVVDNGDKVDVTDVIDSQDAQEEIDELNAYTEEINNSIDAGSEVVDQLDDLKDQNTEVIEQINDGNIPEEVAKDAVVAAQEAFSIQLSKLGYTREDFHLHKRRLSRISRESADGEVVVETEPSILPAEELAELNSDIEVAQEGISDNIKAFYNRFKANTDKMKEKGEKMISVYQRQINGLLTMINDQSATINGNPDINKIFNIAPLYIAANGNKFDVKSFSDYVADPTLNSGVITKNMKKLEEFKSLRSKGEIFDKMKKLSIEYTEQLKKTFNQGANSRFYTITKHDVNEVDEMFVGVLAIQGKKYDIAVLKNSMPSWTTQVLAFIFSPSIPIPPLNVLTNLAVIRKFFFKYAHNIMSERKKFRGTTPDNIVLPNTKAEIIKQLKELQVLCNGYSLFVNKLSLNYTKCVDEMAKVNIIADNQPLPLLNAELVGKNNQYLSAIRSSISIFNQLIS